MIDRLSENWDFYLILNLLAGSFQCAVGQIHASINLIRPDLINVIYGKADGQCQQSRADMDRGSASLAHQYVLQRHVHAQSLCA